MADEPLDAATIAWLTRTKAMSDITGDHVVNDMWQRVRFARHTRLPFALIGGLDWQAPLNTSVLALKGELRLRSSFESDEGLENVSPPTTHNRVIWADLHVPADREDPREALPVFRKALERVQTLVDLLSVLYGFPLTWYPAVYEGVQSHSEDDTRTRRLIPTTRHSAEMARVIVNTEDFSEAVFPRLEALEQLPDIPFRLVLRTALNWHSQGNAIHSGLNRFLNYWSAVELLGTYLHDHLPVAMTGALSQSARRSAVLALAAQPPDSKECFDWVEQLAELRRPTIRTKSKVLALFAADGRDLEKKLFGKSESGLSSMYSIRNDIAHGNVSLHHHDFLALVDKRLDEMRRLSRSVILRILYLAQGLVAHLPPFASTPTHAA
jgi:hypothetical protein